MNVASDATQVGLVAAFGASLLLLLWGMYLTRRGSDHAARPGTMEAFWAELAPTMALLMVAMLLDKLPRMFWPTAESLHLAGSIAAKLMLAGLIVTSIRRIVLAIQRRRLQGQA